MFSLHIDTKRGRHIFQAGKSKRDNFETEVFGGRGFQRVSFNIREHRTTVSGLSITFVSYVVCLLRHFYWEENDEQICRVMTYQCTLIKKIKINENTPFLSKIHDVRQVHE